MNIESRLSLKGIGKYNDDVIGNIDNLYFVFDGATALFNDNLFSSTSDLFEYMQKLSCNILNEGDLTCILTNAIEKTTKHFNIKGFEEYECPTFTVAMIKEEEKYLDYYVIGDAYIIIKKKDNTIFNITDDRIDPFKKDNKEKIGKVPDGPDKEKMIKKIEQETRMKLNKSFGYKIASVKKESAQNGMIGRIMKEEIDYVILCSDGFVSLPFNNLNKFTKEGIQEHIDNIFKNIVKRDDISFIALNNKEYK